MAFDLEPLPPAVLQALTADVPRAFVEQLVRCAADDLVREHVALSRKPGAKALVTEWRALGRDVSTLQSAYGVVSALLVQFARENPRGAVAQRQALADSGLDDPEFVAFVLPLLEAVAPPIRSVLTHSSFDFANVVDVTWRLDYVLRSSSAGSIHEPLYFVQLQLQTPAGRVEPLAFTCSVDELRDVVYRLQEAVSELEKLAFGGASVGPLAAASVDP